jgi:hypothetical protein
MTPQQTAFLAAQREKCSKKLHELIDTVVQFDKAGCDRFSSQRYLMLLQERNDLCRGILNPQKAQRIYRNIDDSVVKFAWQAARMSKFTY